MGDSNKINYSLGGSGYALQNLLTNSSFGVCAKADSFVTIDEVSKVQNPDFASSVGWLLDTNWSVSGGVLNAVNVVPSQFAQQIITGLTPYGNYAVGVSSPTGADTWYTSTVSDGRIILAGNTLGNGPNIPAGVANAKGELTYRIHSPVASLNGTFDNVTLNRTDPVFTNANSDAPHGWQKLGVNFPTLTVTGDLSVMQTNSTSSLKVVNSVSADTSDGVYYDISSPSFKRVLTFGCYVLQNVASSIQVGFSNDTLTVHSSVNSAITGSTSANYVWLETTIDNTSGTYSKVGMRITAPNTTAYITQPMLVNGVSIGEGNYNRPVREWIDLETGDVTGVRWSHASLWGSLSGRVELDRSLPEISNGKIPGNICEVDMMASAQSVSGSVGLEIKSTISGDRHLIVSYNNVGDNVAASGLCLVKSGAINVEAPLNSINSIDLIFKRVCVTY